MTTTTDRIAALLGGVAVPGAFSARRSAKVDDLGIEVRGVGPLRFPVPDVQAKLLCAVGRPARYGRGEQTLLDRQVRDTWEIPKSRVKIDKRRWAKTLVPVLDRLREDLGLPSGCQLDAELHSMLVYEPGQFFVAHQDSEKADEMVGTLVVTLPGSSKGGALVVEHAGQTSLYRPSAKSLTFVAFYADCRHEVKPITSGYRVALTYNLLLRGDAIAPAAEAEPGLADELACCIEEHFTTPIVRRRSNIDDAGDPPRRLVYLLDHEYTERGLAWTRLKGNDSRRAALLQAVAGRVGCEAVLGLAQVHETWGCYESDRGRSRSWYRDWDDLADGGPRDSNSSDLEGYELDDLIDSETALECWASSPAERAEPIALSVPDFEVCATTPSVDLQPYESEYEGYMGNYGNTMDRWYRRGAVVIWPHHLAFAVRAEASPVWALDELSKRLRGSREEAQEMAATLAPFWSRVMDTEQRRGVVTKVLRVASTLDEPALAAMLLAPLRLEVLAPSHASPLVGLFEQYGEAWVKDLLDAWSGGARSWSFHQGKSREEWIATLAQLCQRLHGLGVSGTSTATLLVIESWGWLHESIKKGCRIESPSRRDKALGDLGPALGAVLQSAAVVEAADLRDEAVRFLCEGGESLTGCLMGVLRATGALSPADRRAAGLDVVADHCSRVLEARLAHPSRAADDWSIEVPDGCSCDLCVTLCEFAADPSRRLMEWPIAEDRRRHVHARIDDAELAIGHVTRKVGRPYTLVLTKTEAIFEREKQVRLGDEEDLAWLRAGWRQ